MRRCILLVLGVLVALSVSSCGLFRKKARQQEKRTLRTIELRFRSDDREENAYTIRTAGMKEALSLSESSVKLIQVFAKGGDTLSVIMPWGYTLLKEAIPADATGVVVVVNTLQERLAFARGKESIDTVYARVVKALQSEPYPLEDFPRVPGCLEVEDPMRQRRCFQRVLGRIISRHFDTEVVSHQGDRVRLMVEAEVDSTGHHRLLGVGGAFSSEVVDEVKRVLGFFPVAEPVMHRGRAVSVRYTLPIVVRFVE